MDSSDLRQSIEYSCYMEKIGWSIDYIQNKKETRIPLFVKKLPFPFFSFIKIQRSCLPLNWKQLAKISKKRRAIQTKIEPNLLKNQPNRELIKNLEKHGYKQDRSPLLPTKTIWVDLTKTKKQLLKEMHHQTRHNIRKSATLNLLFEPIRGDKITDKQLRQFYHVYKKNTQRQKFWGLNFKQLKSLMDCFADNSYLLCVWENLSNHSLLGGLILLIHNQIAYYSHNGATIQGKKQLVPTLLTWEGIKLAKKLKCTRFDFEGISDHHFPITEKWQGFSRFKKGFGGKEIEYVGSFTKGWF